MQTLTDNSKETHTSTPSSFYEANTTNTKIKHTQEKKGKLKLFSFSL